MTIMSMFFGWLANLEMKKMKTKKAKDIARRWKKTITVKLPREIPKKIKTEKRGE